MQENWYVLFVRSQDEYKVMNLLLSNKLSAFIPKMKVVHRKEGNVNLVDKIMFPGYVFIESELNQADFTALVNKIKMKTSKGMKLLKHDNEGTSVLYPEEKEQLMKLLGKDKVMEQSVGIIEGDHTIIVDGPLKGLENTIVKIDRHKRKALIEILICNQPTRINVSLEIISKC